MYFPLLSLRSRFSSKLLLLRLLLYPVKVIQIGEDVKRGTILNYPLLRQRCDVDGFLHTHVEPLR